MNHFFPLKKRRRRVWICGSHLTISNNGRYVVETCVQLTLIHFLKKKKKNSFISGWIKKIKHELYMFLGVQSANNDWPHHLHMKLYIIKLRNGFTFLILKNNIILSLLTSNAENKIGF